MIKLIRMVLGAPFVIVGILILGGDISYEVLNKTMNKINQKIAETK